MVPMKLDHLRTCHLENPIGYQMDKPVLLWKLTECDTKGVVSRIAVKGSDGSFYETDFSYHDSLGTTLDIELQPRPSPKCRRWPPLPAGSPCWSPRAVSFRKKTWTPGWPPSDFPTEEPTKSACETTHALFQ